MKDKNYNWLVRVYGKDEINIIDSFVIQDRTEHYASREAENDLRVRRGEDWTMTKTNRKY